MKVGLSFGRETPQRKRGPYRTALTAAGVETVENPATLHGLDGLVLAGGTDVDPALYGQEPLTTTDEPDQERDKRELALVQEALDADAPILAICRGMQLLNVACGGTLHQHVKEHRDPDKQNVHVVRPTSGTVALLFGRDDYWVNSRHHQAVATIGRDLVVTATAPDGTIEALEIPGRRFVVAVQWHPEDRIDGSDRSLFVAFAEALSKSGPHTAPAPSPA